MGFKKQGRFAGAEDHLPDSRYPRLPVGLHLCKIQKADTFSHAVKKHYSVAIAELRVINSDVDGIEGKTFSWVKVQNEHIQYFLGAVRGFTSAALGMDIDDVDADIIAAAFFDRDSEDEQVNIAKGEEIVVEVTPNPKKEDFPNIVFYAAK